MRPKWTLSALSSGCGVGWTYWRISWWVWRKWKRRTWRRGAQKGHLDCFESPPAYQTPHWKLRPSWSSRNTCKTNMFYIIKSSEIIRETNVDTYAERNSYLWMLKLLPDSAWLFRFLSNVSVAVLMRGTICNASIVPTQISEAVNTTNQCKGVRLQQSAAEPITRNKCSLMRPPKNLKTNNENGLCGQVWLDIKM